MLVSVTDRPREIWIRQAIWATNWSILTPFLIDSIILTTIWAIIAILLAYLIASLLTNLLAEQELKVVINVVVLSWWIWVAFFMWIIFGIMPAYKAAKLKPIDALHFE